MHRKASAGTQDLRKVCSTLACKCNSRDLVHCLCIPPLQWRLWAATPPKSTQPCQAESRLVLSKLQRKMCQLWRPLAEATQRLAPGVPHVHIHRAVEVVASPAHMKEDTTPSTSRFGSVKHAVVRNGYPPCPMCGLQRPQESRYHVKVMPHWTCKACHGKVLSQSAGKFLVQKHLTGHCV